VEIKKGAGGKVTKKVWSKETNKGFLMKELWEKWVSSQKLGKSGAKVKKKPAKGHR